MEIKAPTIREAVPDDATAISALLLQLGYPLDPVTIRDKIGAFAHSISCCYVAEGSSGVVGMLSMSLVPSFDQVGSVARITSLVVLDSSRGHGAGRDLVAVAEAYAWSHRCIQIEVSSDGRLGAEGFYARKGYTVDADRFIKHNPELPQ